MNRTCLTTLCALAVLSACGSWNTLNKEHMLPPEARPSATPTTPRNVRATPWQRETFGKLVEFVGHTYRGEPLEGSSGAVADIQAWNWAIGGAGISIRHALEDRSYGGETIVYFDAETDALAYVYITNAGFRTEGTFEVAEDGSWAAEEAVTGHDTITKVRSTGTQRSDGSLLSESEYYENGEWRSGNRFLYREVVDAVPELDIPKRKK
ncbi:MAG: hypothetical protein AAFY34_13675 [Pseudomonadota bacterium]